MHVEALLVILEIRITCGCADGVFLKLVCVSEIALRCNVLCFRESEISCSFVVVLYRGAAIARVVGMVLPLAALIAKRLLEGQSRHRLNVQFHHHLGFEPLVGALIGVEVSIGHNVIVERLVLPDVESGLRFIVVG